MHILSKIIAAGSLSLLFNPLVFADKSNNTLDYASTKDIRDINPHLYSGEMAAQNMIFESLVINTPEGIQPFLAKDWKIYNDGKKYIFNLREDVFFTDGEHFTAEAAKLNIDAVLDNHSRHAWLELVNQIDSVKVLGKYQLEINLKNPYYPTLTELGLTRPFRFISPQAFIDKKTKHGVQSYAGTGPWILSEYKKNQFAKFQRNQKYWGQQPALNAVVWNVIPDKQTLLLALQKGDVQLIFGADGDMLGIDAFNALKASHKIQAAMSPPIASRAIVLNSNRPITGDKQVRQALQHAVDKTGIATGIFGGTEDIAQTLMSKSIPYANVEQAVYAYSPQKSAELLRDAGWILKDKKTYREKNNQAMEIVFSYNINNSAEKEIAELIQDNLKNVGVKVKLIGEEKQAYLDRQRNGDFDMQYSLSWGTPYDPASFVSSFRIPSHADYQGQIGLKNKPEIDASISELLITQKEENRKKLYSYLFSKLADEAVYIPLTYSRTKAIFRKEIKNIDFSPSQYEIPFEKIKFE